LIRGNTDGEAQGSDESNDESCKKKDHPHREEMWPVSKLVERFSRWFAHALSFLYERCHFLDDQYRRERSVLPNVSISSEVRLGLLAGSKNGRSR